jgi:TolA-binding protein
MLRPFRPRPLREGLIFGGLLVSLALPLAAHAQVESREGIALQNEIDELRHELASIERRLGNGSGSGSLLGAAEAPPPTAKSAKGGSDILPQLVDRVSTLEDQVRELRGKLEELQNTVDTQNANLNKAIDDLRFRLDQMQGGKAPGAAGEAEAGAAGLAAGAAGAAAGEKTSGGEKGEGDTLSPPPRPLGALPVAPGSKEGETAMASPKAGATPAAPPAPPKAATLLAEATTALGRKDYAAAENAAQAAEQAAKAAKNAHDLVEARLLLARAYYGDHQYQKAALAYDDAYKVAPKGPRAPDALLGLAQALIALNAKPAACDALDRVAREFPQSRPAQERAALLRQRAACG